MPEEYAVVDAEAAHAAAPRSFFIPALTEREHLQPGDLAKLLFTVDGEVSSAGERMWVIVLEVTSDGNYVGQLDNDPVVITTLQAGAPVHFGPQHVIAVHEDWPLLSQWMFVGRRILDEDLAPVVIYREDPFDEAESGWRAFMGNETVDEFSDRDYLQPITVGHLIDLWPQTRPVFESDPVNQYWMWNDADSAYHVWSPPAAADAGPR